MFGLLYVPSFYNPSLRLRFDFDLSSPVTTHAQDTLDFCRDTLGAPDVLHLLQARFVCWAGSIADAEAHRLAASLGPLAYPFR